MSFHVRITITVLAILALCLFLGCEVDTRVSIDGANPPTFSFTGSGYLTFFSVNEIASENANVADVEQDRAKNKTIWSVWPSQPLATPMSKTPPITYGKIPKGFYQKVPQDAPAPALVEGKVYEAGGPAASANGGYVRFTVRDGKTVELPTPARR